MKANPLPMERRRFMKMIALSGAAVLAGGAPGARAKAPPPRKPRHEAPRPIPPAVEKEIRAQKKSLAETLKVVREFSLPPGSPPASVFRALRARKER